MVNWSARRFTPFTTCIVPAIVLCLSSVGQQNPSKPDEPGIQDNSFLVEEAYNQNIGVVQPHSSLRLRTVLVTTRLLLPTILAKASSGLCTLALTSCWKLSSPAPSRWWLLIIPSGRTRFSSAPEFAGLTTSRMDCRLFPE